MKKFIMILCVCILAFSCASKKETIPQASDKKAAKKPGEKLVWSSNDKRPAWTISEPDMEGEYLYFVGLSDMYATEKNAREDARRNAVNIVVSYLGTEVKEKFESIVTRFGLTSDIADPTRASRNFEQQLKNSLISKVKAKEWYIEQWQNVDKEIYWKAYLLAKVLKSSLDRSFQQEINGVREKLLDAKHQANNERAKKQYEDAMDAFNKAAKDGFSN